MNIRLQKFPLILIIVFFSMAAFAADKIEGAFGMKFGDTFDTSSAIGIIEGKNGIRNYQFNTTNVFRPFKNYFVMVTPKTHKIYSIWAVGKIGDLQAGKKEQLEIMELLGKQFGNNEVSSTDFEIHQGNRIVATKLVGNIDVTIAILYSDSDLKKLADEEELAAK